jgi:hypothetical protein
VVKSRNRALTDKLSEQKSRNGSEPEGSSPRGASDKTKNSDMRVNEKGDEAQGNGVHKKKLKKNIDSRDAVTQTERSDYMLIKQRQKQKEIIALHKQGLLPPGINAQHLLQ